MSWNWLAEAEVLFRTDAPTVPEGMKVTLLSGLICAIQAEYNLAERTIENEQYWEATLKLLQSQQEVGLLREDVVIDAQIGLVSKKQLLEQTRFKQQLEYAVLQKAVGGNWKWTP